MLVSIIIDEDFNHYKTPSLLIGTSQCHRKCKGCHNEHLKNKNYDSKDNLLLCARYINNPITKAVVIAGLEAFDTFQDTRAFYKDLRRFTQDTVVIYTGYDEEEIKDEINDLIKIGGHLIIKYGRYIEGDTSYYNNLLGVTLASSNQYAIEYNNENKET